MLIKICVRGAASIPVDEFEEFEFLQGDLKSLSEENYEKLKREILIEGFSFCVTVWRQLNRWVIIDGTQRVRTVRRMIEEGYQCPFLPIDIVEAESYDEARRKLMGGASVFGDVERDELMEYVTKASITHEELRTRWRLPNTNIEKFIESNYDKSEDTAEPPPTTVEVRHASRATKKLTLSFDLDRHSVFMMKAKYLMNVFEKDNLSDLIFEVVDEMYEDILEESREAAQKSLP